MTINDGGSSVVLGLLGRSVASMVTAALGVRNSTTMAVEEVRIRQCYHSQPLSMKPKYISKRIKELKFGRNKRERTMSPSGRMGP